MRHRFQSLTEVFNYSISKFSKRKAFCFADGSETLTYREFGDRCRHLSEQLANFGINSGDRIAILSQNMPNWPVAYFASVAFGRIAVPMLTELTPNEVGNIITHSEAKAAFVSKRLYDKIPSEALAQLRIVFYTDDLSIARVGEEAYTCNGTISAPTPDDLACIIYTSGTSGAAKGVMLSHRNFCMNILEAWKAQHVYKKDVFLSILPLAHTYEMSIGMLYPFSTGCPVYYIQKPPTPTILADALLRIRPTTILSVPLIIEKVIRGKIFPTINGSKYLRYLKKHFPRILYFLVGKKVKQQFGGRVRFFGVGGSKLDKEVEQFLRNIKFPYAIGYGLTETAPLICDAGPKRTHLGTTGTSSFEVQVRLADVNPENGQGELQVKGPNVMLGYYKDYQRTKAVFTEDGWMRTGDIATVDKKGRYSILGRSGSVIIGASGENIYPEEIESVINNISDVNESLVISRSGQLVALVQFNDGAIDWNLEGQEKFLENLEKRKKEVMEFVNSKVSQFLKIKDVEVMKEPFSKTATHKIRRFLYQDKDKNKK